MLAACCSIDSWVNSIPAFVYAPVLEGVSEGATQVTQNLIDGKPWYEGVDHAAFLGLSMGMGISQLGFTTGMIQSTFSDHKSIQGVRDNITEMQKLANRNANIVTKIGLLEKRGLSTDQAYQELADNQNRIDKLQDIVKSLALYMQKKAKGEMWDA